MATKYENYDIDLIHLAANKRDQRFYFEGRGIIPTANNLYLSMRGKGGRIMRIPSPQLRTFKESIRQLIAHKKGLFRTREGRDWYRLSIKIYMPMLTKAGKVRRWDISNRIKALEDAITEALGLEDSFISVCLAEKVDDPDMTVQSYRFSVDIRQV